MKNKNRIQEADVAFDMLSYICTLAVQVLRFALNLIDSSLQSILRLLFLTVVMFMLACVFPAKAAQCQT